MAEDEPGDESASEEDASQSEGDASVPEWKKEVEKARYRKVTTLAAASEPVEARQVWVDFSAWDENAVDFLTAQTERTLDRHAEIQQSQRDRAYSVLRTSIVVVGALSAITLRSVPFFRSLQFAETLPLWRPTVALILTLVAAYLGGAIILDVFSIIDSTLDVLSPEMTERGLIGRIFGLVFRIGPVPGDEEEGGSVRSASILDELAPVVDDPGQGIREEVIVNRLNRIRLGEKAIDQDRDHLHDLFQRAKYDLERIIGIFLLLSLSAMFLGVSIQ